MQGERSLLRVVKRRYVLASDGSMPDRSHGLGDATGARSEPPCQVVLYYKTHLAIRFLLLTGFVLQRSQCITTACTTPKTAQSTVAHHLIETVGDFVFQQRNQLWIAALIFIGDVEGDDSVVWGALLELLPDPFAMVVFHDDDQVSLSHKLVGQRGWCIRIRASRLRLDAKVIPEHIFSGRASQLVGGANEQDFHGRHYSAWRCAAESLFSTVTDASHLYHFHLVVRIEHLKIAATVHGCLHAIERQMTAKCEWVISNLREPIKSRFHD